MTLIQLRAMKKRKKKTNKKNDGFTIDNSIRSYANEPAFIKKVEEGRKFIQKVGFPDESLWKN